MHEQKNFFIEFMKLAGPFWNSENRLMIWIETVALVGLTILQIGLAVYITKWNAALFDALEQHSMNGVKAQIVYLILIFFASISISTLHLIIKRRLLIGWRNWLTEKVIVQWMQKGKHYQISFLPHYDHDNPDGRIAEDIRIATEDAINLCHSLFYCLLMLGSFTKILWGISGKVVFDFGHLVLPVSGYLVWIAVSYSLCASMLGWWMGRSMTKATHARQTKEANFRHDLIDAQAHSLPIALIRGEAKEQSRLLASYRAIVETYAMQTSAWIKIQIFSSGYSVTSMALPILVASPRYIAGAISLGLLIQSVQAFQHMVSALSWPVDNMAQIAKWRTSVERVVGLANALAHLQSAADTGESSRIGLLTNAGSALQFESVLIRDVDGETLSQPVTASIRPGERIVISDQTNSGALLFKSIAGLWPWGSGTLLIPDNSTLFFMPPKPYLPTAALLESICYPKNAQDFDVSRVEDLLNKVGQKDLVKQLRRVNHWDQTLSNEQQQCLGLVRVLLHRPKWLFIQEALDSLSPEDEISMLELIVRELPDTGIVTMTHQPAAQAFHSRTLAI